MKKIFCRLLLAFMATFSFELAFGQNKLILPDSTLVNVIPKYDSVGRFHRWAFGENYRKDYAAKTKLPILAISKLYGGLKVLQLGGGNQSKSLRLVGTDGREWTLRSVEKYPEVLLPTGLQNTFLKDIIKDNMSAQHPYSALIIPVLARKIGAPYGNPVIGVVARDANLGPIGEPFIGTVALLEEREPAGKSDNSSKMTKKLVDDIDNEVDAPLLLKLKCLDVLTGDWDRHEDQWRWLPERNEKGIRYKPVPRDRDQVFFRSEGKIQRFTQTSVFLPMMQGFERDIQDINWFLWEGREIYSRWFNEIDKTQWDAVVQEFCMQMDDATLEESLAKLPEPGYSLRHDELLNQMKRRREAIPKLMSDYYGFFNRIVDIELSNKNESVHISDTLDNRLAVRVVKIGKDNDLRQVYSRIFEPDVTREIRVYLHEGNDRVLVNNHASRVKIRIIGGEGVKNYTVEEARKNIKLYDLTEGNYSGREITKLTRHIRNDSAQVAYVPKDLYGRRSINPNIGYNVDDGIAIGLATKFYNPGFRKQPVSNIQSVSFLYSAATKAFRVNYKGEWLKTFGKADFVVEANVLGPSNTQNFFGYGNETPYDKDQNIRYYRSRYDLYELFPSLRFKGKASTFRVGLAFQAYSYDQNNNEGRLINNKDLLHSADSTNVAETKFFAGIALNYQWSSLDSYILPKKGISFEVNVKAYEGINSYSNAFAQLTPSFSFYQKLDKQGILVLSDRIGGGLSLGKPAFFQSLYLGGQGNLSGYRQFRFAGKHSVYNNLVLRLKMGNLINYILPGEFGLTALYDVGRVWRDNEHSNVLHHGFGGGLYFSPAGMTVIQINANVSKEGVYPSFAMRWRY